MTSFRSLVAVVACASIVPLALGGAAWAAPSGPNTLTYHFTNCDGPRTEYEGVKQAEAAAVHLTDASGGGIFVFMEAVDVLTGAVLFSTPGFEHNGLTTAVCDFTHPATREVLRVTGLLAPASR
jgi:hypothetical protein